jgi:large subunit ribosomal protein L6
MRKEIKEIVIVPEGIEIETKDRVVSIKKGGKEVTKRYEGFNAKREDNKIVLYNEKATKNEKKLLKSFAAHLRNAIKGLQEKYIYQLKICFVHFPVTVELKGNEFLVKNFLGEKVPRKAKILPDVDVKLEKDLITISSCDKEKAGQTAANIETATRIRNRDRRVFQDGIFIIKKSKGKAG